MVKKIGWAVLFVAVGAVLGAGAVMAVMGSTMARGMFVLQEYDLFHAEEAAREAFLHAPPEVGIWALEYYLDFFDSVLEQRTGAAEGKRGSPDDVFVLVEPKLQWTSYVRLGVLYRKVGQAEKAEACFQKAAETMGRQGDAELNEKLIELVEKLDREGDAAEGNGE